MPPPPPLSLLLGIQTKHPAQTQATAINDGSNDIGFGPAIPRGNWARRLALRRAAPALEPALKIPSGSSQGKDAQLPQGRYKGKQKNTGGREESGSEEEQADQEEQEAEEDPWGVGLDVDDGTSDSSSSASSEEDGDQPGSDPADQPRDAGQTRARRNRGSYRTGWTTSMTTWWEDPPISSSLSPTAAPIAAMQRARSASSNSAATERLVNSSAAEREYDRRRKTSVVGSTTGYRVATGHRDGSVWIFRSVPRRSHTLEQQPQGQQRECHKLLLSPQAARTTAGKSDGFASPSSASSWRSTASPVSHQQNTHNRLRSISAQGRSTTAAAADDHASETHSISGFAPQPPLSSASEVSTGAVAATAATSAQVDEIAESGSATGSVSVVSTSVDTSIGSGGGAGARLHLPFWSSSTPSGGGGKDASSMTPAHISAEALLEAQYHAGEQHHSTGGGGLIAGAVGRLFQGHGVSAGGVAAGTDEHHSHQHTQYANSNRSATPMGSAPSDARTRAIDARSSMSSPSHASAQLRAKRTPPPMIVTDADTDGGLPSASVSASAGADAISTDPTDFKRLEAVLCLSTSDRSPVVALQLVQYESQLLVLQESGALTMWSLLDGAAVASLDLASLAVYPHAAPTPSTAAVNKAESQGFLGMPAQLASLAALRSHAASPVPGGAGVNGGGQAGSRTTSRRGSHSSSTAGEAGKHLLQHQHHHAESRTAGAGDNGKSAATEHRRLLVRFGKSMQVLTSDGASLPSTPATSYAVLIDTLRRLVVIVSIGRRSLRVIGTRDLSPQADSVAALLDQDGARIKLLSLDAGREGKLLISTITVGATEQPNVLPHSHSQPFAPSSGSPLGLSVPLALPAALRSAQAQPTTGTSTPVAPPPLWAPLQTLKIDQNGKKSEARGVRALGLLLLAWSDDGIALFAELDGKYRQIEYRAVEKGLSHVSLTQSGRGAILERTHGSRASFSVMPISQSGFLPEIERPFALPTDAPVCDVLPDVLEFTTVLSLMEGAADGLTIVLSSAADLLPTEVFAQKQDEGTSNGASALVALSLDKVMEVDSSGRIATRPFEQTVKPRKDETRHSVASDMSTLTLLSLVLHPRSQTKLLIGGTETGDVLIWDTKLEALQTKMTQFDCAVSQCVLLSSRDAGSPPTRLQDTLAVVAVDGTVVLISLEGYKLFALIPGRGSALDRMAVRADEVLLIYADGDARVWDMRSHELRHSMPFHRALSMLEDGGARWTQYSTSPALSTPNAGKLATGVLRHVSAPAPFSTSSMLSADLRKAIEAAAKNVAMTGMQSDATANGGGLSARKCSIHSPGAAKAVSILSPFLSALWPRTADGQLEFVGKEQYFAAHIDLRASSVVHVGCMGFPSHHEGEVQMMAVSSMRSATAAAQISTTQRLCLAAMLRVLAHVDELADDSARALSRLSMRLIRKRSASDDEAFLALSTLAPFLNDSSAEIGESARDMCDVYLSRLSDEAVAALVESQAGSGAVLSDFVGEGDQMPCSGTMRPIDRLALLGRIAYQRMTALNPSALKLIATAVERCLNDASRPERQLVALELCQKGFGIWQNYVDAMELVRTLFAIAASQEPANNHVNGSSNLVELRSVARQATLRVAKENTPLFMTTLSHDILHARSAAHASATMRLVAFMVRRQADLLYPNLPRLAEAVVKSLDPNGGGGGMREKVVEAATVMMSELVRSYPSIDFQARLQRLAVGTQEGAVILYDLKTATRLYVVEAHRTPLTACSFSPDGRRLATISLQEGRALIWKVGSSFGSLFTPGLPRQGGTDASGAYKAFDFLHLLGNQSPAPPREQLEQLAFSIRAEWTGEHSSVKISFGSLTSISIDAM